MDSLDFRNKILKIRNNNCEYFKKILEKSNLTRIEFEISNYIYFCRQKNIKVTASVLAEHFEVSIAGVMHRLDSLEKKRVIIKNVDKGDKRCKYYDISLETLQKYESLYQRHVKHIDKYLASLKEEVSHLEKILDITINFLEDCDD